MTAPKVQDTRIWAVYDRATGRFCRSYLMLWEALDGLVVLSRHDDLRTYRLASVEVCHDPSYPPESWEGEPLLKLVEHWATGQ